MINFFFFLAEQVRGHMAKLGFRTINEMVGRVDKIDAAVADAHWKAKGIDLSNILYAPTLPSRVARRCVQAQDHGLDQALDHALIAKAASGAGIEGPRLRAASQFATFIARWARCWAARLRDATGRRDCRMEPFITSFMARRARASAPLSLGRDAGTGRRRERLSSARGFREAGSSLILRRPRAFFPKRAFWWATWCSMGRRQVKRS